MKDVYGQLINIIKKHGSAGNTPTMQLGIVENTSPLIIKSDNLPLTKEDLLISEHLLDTNREFDFNVNASGNVNCPNGTGSIQNININKANINFKSNLKVGDIVVIIPIEEGQVYVVLCKIGGLM